MARHEKNALSNVEAVVWDMDGVLIDTYLFEFMQNLDFMLKHGAVAMPGNYQGGDYVLPKDESDRILAKMEEAFLACNGDARKNYETLLDMPGLYDQFEQDHIRGIDTYRNLIIPSEGALQALGRIALSDMTQALWTSRERQLLTPERSAGIIKQPRIGPRREGYFDMTVSADDVGYDNMGATKTKPNPAGMEIIADTLAIPPERMVMIGDRPSDILPAKLLGAKAIGMASGFMRGHPDLLYAAGADTVVSSVSEVEDLLFGTP